jgi:thiamine biosynthesis lipoprotein ApbE
VVVADTATLDLSIDSVAQGSFVDAIYSQTEMMTVTAAHVIGNDIEFIGTNFP